MHAHPLPNSELRSWLPPSSLMSLPLFSPLHPTSSFPTFTSICYVLWSIAFHKGHLCDCGFEVVHWSLVVLYVCRYTTKENSCPLLQNPSVSSNFVGRGRKNTVIPFLVHDLLLIARSCAGPFWAAKATVWSCDLALVMLFLGDGNAQPFSLSSFFNIFSVLFSLMFPESYRVPLRLTTEASLILRTLKSHVSLHSLLSLQREALLIRVESSICLWI